MQKSDWQLIAENLIRRIESGELAPGSRIQTEESIAKELGVSRHAAHRAVHELHRLGLVERRRRWGTVVAEQKKKKRRVAYVADFTDTSFQSDIMLHLGQALGDEDRLMVCSSRNDHEREAENLIGMQNEVDGIVCFPVDGDANSKLIQSIAESGFPVVLIDRAPVGCEHLAVMTDNFRASETAVKQLIARGHTRIAYFGINNDEAQSIRERYQGYVSAVRDLGYVTKPYERRVQLKSYDYSEATLQAVMDAFVALRCLPEPPTAAFCAQDLVAIGVIEACAQHSLQLGSDFGLATYNDFGPIFLRQFWRIDRVVQQVDQIATVAVERLKALIDGQSIAPGPVRIAAEFLPIEDASVSIASQLNHR